ncbi:MAG: DUF2905 domain-containing protein [Candidatus Omnitrophica bacterium]|jgi:hypothetical protein|nr:DUF2905 domain-containing protein [Candidatus Omnitrophota bacterium]
MESLAKSLIFIGVSIFILGLVLLIVVKLKIPFLGRLPGDISIQKENFSFYFPLTSGIIISIILSLLFRIFLRK